METAGRGLEGTMKNVARMLAIVDFEEDEDKRVFGFSRSANTHYANLRDAARAAVIEASRAASDDNADTPT